MNSEAKSTTTIHEALDLYVRSIRGGGKSKSKARGGELLDHSALQHFVRYFSPQALICELKPSDIGAYAETVNGSGTTPGATEHLNTVKGFLAYVKKKEELTEENLARYVRIRKARAKGGASVVASETQTIELTPEGHAQLKAQLEKLVSEKDGLVDEIRRARADGDVTENSPLDAAREEQGRVTARIQEITATLENAVILEEGQARASMVVKIGARVEVKDLGRDGEPKVYTLVNRNEANPLEARISDDSPMGKALLGKRVGEEVPVNTPSGEKRYEVVGIA